jgi:tetratricopeptide (TPR) repeat protein
VAEKELKYQEAVDAFVRAKQLGYGGSDLDLMIGDLYMKLGQSDKARRFLAAGVADANAPPEVVYNYAVSLIREKKYSAAVAPLQRVVAELPEMPQAWQALASALRMNKQYGEAVPAYEKALTFGDDPKLWFNLGFCQSRSNQEEAAVESYRTALALDPTFKEAYYNLGRTLMSQNQYEDALTVMADHLMIEPDSYRILFNQGFCLYQLGRFEDSIQQYELALEQKETADVYNNIGLAYDKLGDKEMDQTYFREAKGLRGGSR